MGRGCDQEAKHLRAFSPCLPPLPFLAHPRPRDTMEASTSTVHTDHLHAAPVAWSPPKRRVGGSLKGKERALEERSYPGAITYRHLLAPGSGGPT